MEEIIQIQIKRVARMGQPNYSKSLTIHGESVESSYLRIFELYNQLANTEADYIEVKHYKDDKKAIE